VTTAVPVRSAPTYRTLLARPADIEAAQRLRARVFAECGAALPPLDVDECDDRCDHLVVGVDETGEVVGTYRLLPPLVRGYLALGARVCGRPAHDPLFGTADFDTLLSITDIDPRTLRRLTR
jgi:putative hemolysin